LIKISLYLEVFCFRLAQHLAAERCVNGSDAEGGAEGGIPSKAAVVSGVVVEDGAWRACWRGQRLRPVMGADELLLPMVGRSLTVEWPCIQPVVPYRRRWLQVIAQVWV